MTLSWKKCAMCNGVGEIKIQKSRIQRIKDKIKNPIVEDELQKCPHCKGKGSIYVKSSFPFNPWNPFKRIDDE